MVKTPSCLDFDAWVKLQTSPGIQVSGILSSLSSADICLASGFFQALLRAPIEQVGSFKDLPIAQSCRDCIVMYTDPSTNVEVVCLPYELPQSSLLESHVVFIRPYHFDLIQAMIDSQSRRIVVVGNSGSGTSYIQLVVLLWWARPELRQH